MEARQMSMLPLDVYAESRFLSIPTGGNYHAANERPKSLSRCRGRKAPFEKRKAFTAGYILTLTGAAKAVENRHGGY